MTMSPMDARGVSVGRRGAGALALNTPVRLSQSAGAGVFRNTPN
jgi:hypothetical protein